MSRYNPKAVAAKDLIDLIRLVDQELLDIAAATEPDDIEMPVRFVAPEKTFRGLVVYADGTSWNPGSGEGIYRHNGTAWIFVG